MKTGSNLKRRGATYYARQIVPVELQHLMGRRELIRSLNTTDGARRTSASSPCSASGMSNSTIFGAVAT